MKVRAYPVVAALLFGLGVPVLRPLFSLDDVGVRRPYLQDDRGTAVSVLWTTARPEPTRLRFRRLGKARETELNSEQDPARRHRVRLSRLVPGAEYEYRVVGGTTSPGWTRFRTRPERTPSFRFAVLGDIGDTFPNDARAAARLLQQEAPDFAIALGDLVYPAGREGLLTDRFFHPLEGYSSGHVLWHVFGNHDVKADGGRPLDLASEAPGNGPAGIAPGRTYSFDYGNAHFVSIDSNLPGVTLRDRVAPWLERDLRRTRRAWKIVVMHHPPFSSGKHGNSRKLQNTLVPTLSRCGVDLVFTGHDHDYERFKPIGGVTYIVSGDGGAGLYPFKQAGAASAVRENRHHGLTVIDIRGTKARLRHVLDNGRAVDDVELVAHAPSVPRT